MYSFVSLKQKGGAWRARGSTGPGLDGNWTKGEPVRDLRDTMIAGIALAHHAALIGCETCCVGVRPCDPGVIRSFLHRPDCSQAKQTVVGRDQRKVREQWRTETDLRDRVVGSTSHPRDRADRPAAPAAISATAQE
jgi:hypothetical protein